MKVGLMLFIEVGVGFDCYNFAKQADKLGEWIGEHISCG